jgi:hypothetical protein
MNKNEIYQARLPELKPLIFALQAAIELYGREKAKELARVAFEKYAYDRFVAGYAQIPPAQRWAKFRDELLEYADDTQYAIDFQEKNRVKIKYQWCVFLEIFRDHGLADFVPLYCATDFTTCQQIHPGITMTRTQTLADGASCCDHCWTYHPE